jgi:chemotaxis methyl-accepting protein methylase
VHDRIEALGLGNAGEYFNLLEDSLDARAEWLALIDLLSVKETRFFRQPAAMEALASDVQARLSRGQKRPLTVWSAGCSTGQELYSIGMVIESLRLSRAPELDWYGIGTDISFEAVSRSQLGRYPESSVTGVPDRYRDTFIERVDEDEWQVSESIQSRTHFFQSNLLHVNSAPYSEFDVIFCQNVLIYFEHDVQLWIIDQLADRLTAGGLLVLGAGEDAWWKNPVMQRQSWPGVCAYRKVEV